MVQLCIQRTQPHSIVRRIVQGAIHMVYMIKPQHTQCRAHGFSTRPTQAQDETAHGHDASAFPAVDVCRLVR